MNKKIYLCLFSCFAVHAQAGNWSLGGGALVNANPYTSMKTNILPIPFISYQGKAFSLYGPIAKLRLPLNRQNIIGLRLQLGMQTFDPGETTDPQMKLLNERKRLFFLGPYYRYRSPFGQFTAGAVYDVSQRSHGGTILDINYAYPFFSSNRKFYIRPGVGGSWFNKKYSQHYYSISQAESGRSSLPTFQSKDFFQPYASLFAGIQLTERLFWTNVIRLNYMVDKVYKSPMVDKRVTYSLITGITYEIGDKNQRFNH